MDENCILRSSLWYPSVCVEKGVMTCGDCPDMETCQTVGMILSNNPDALKNLRG